MAKKGGLFTGVILGSLIGGAYGLLFAQEKGATFRKKIAKTYKEGGDLYNLLTKELGMTAKDASKTMKEFYESDNVQEFVSDWKDKLEEQMETYQGKGEEYADQMKAKLEKLAAFAQKKAKELEKQAHGHVKKATKKAKKTVKKATTKAKSTAKKKVSAVKKKVASKKKA